MTSLVANDELTSEESPTIQTNIDWCIMNIDNIATNCGLIGTQINVTHK